MILRSNKPIAKIQVLRYNVPVLIVGVTLANSVFRGSAFYYAPNGKVYKNPSINFAGLEAVGALPDSTPTRVVLTLGQSMSTAKQEATLIKQPSPQPKPTSSVIAGPKNSTNELDSDYVEYVATLAKPTGQNPKGKTF